MSEDGRKSSYYHTGVDLEEKEYNDIDVKELGIFPVKNIHELFDIIMTLSITKSLKPDNRVTIVSNAGGPAIITTDLVSQQNLRLSDIKNSIINLSNIIPKYGTLRNPLDIIGDADAERYIKVIKTLLENPDINIIIILCAPSAVLKYEELAERLVETVNNSDKLVLVSFMGDNENSRIKEILSGKIPLFHDPEQIIKTLSSLIEIEKLLNGSTRN